MARPYRSAIIPVVFIGLSLAMQSAPGQDYERVAPRPVPTTPEPPLVVPPPPAATGAQPDRLILARLTGLRLLDDAAKLAPKAATEEGITLDGPALLDTPEVRNSLAEFLGKPLTFGGLSEISRVIIVWYREHNRPFVDVAFPEQDVTSGVVQAVVTEFRVGAIKFQNNEWFSTDLLRSEISLAPGDEIDTARVRGDLDRLNENPFRSVAMVAQKSDTPGATDLVFDVTDRLPLRVYGGYDNTGTPALGHDRWNLGFNWGNALWRDQQFAYQLTTSDDFWHHRAAVPGLSDDPAFVAHSVSYAVPVFAGDRILIFGSYEQAVPRLGPSFGLVGVSGQASARYVLPLRPLSFLVHEVQFGYDFKTSNNNLEFGGLTVSNVTSEIDQFPLTYDATATDAFGQTTLENMVVLSPGNITAQNKDAIFEAQAGNPFAKAKYVYDHLAVTRTTRLPYDASWVMRVIGQTADHNLLPSEQLGAGGFDSVRGYDERAASGSLGLLLRQELRTPAFGMLRALPFADVGDQLQLLAFWDYGAVHEKQIAPGTPTSVEIDSVGLGMRYSIKRYLDMRLDYGWQLRKLPGAATRSQMAQLAITVAY